MSQAQANAAVERFQVRSRFADVEVDPRDVVTFPDGLPGYRGADSSCCSMWRTPRR